MNWYQFEGCWKQVSGPVRQYWNKLSSDDVEYICGKRDRLIAKLQQYYGRQRADLETEVDFWITRLPEPEFEYTKLASAS